MNAQQSWRAASIVDAYHRKPTQQEALLTQRNRATLLRRNVDMSSHPKSNRKLPNKDFETERAHYVFSSQISDQSSSTTPHRRTVQSYSRRCASVPSHEGTLANTIELVLHWAHATPQPQRQIDRFSHFCTAHGRVSSDMPGLVLSFNNYPFACGIWVPSNICFLESWVHNPNGISIGSAASAQMTAECQWDAPSPIKIAPSRGGYLDRHLIHGFLGPPESWTQTASRSVQPFLQLELTAVTDRHTDRQTTLLGQTEQ